MMRASHFAGFVLLTSILLSAGEKIVVPEAVLEARTARLVVQVADGNESQIRKLRHECEKWLGKWNRFTLVEESADIVLKVSLGREFRGDQKVNSVYTKPIFVPVTELFIEDKEGRELWRYREVGQYEWSNPTAGAFQRLRRAIEQPAAKGREETL